SNRSLHRAPAIITTRGRANKRDGPDARGTSGPVLIQGVRGAGLVAHLLDIFDGALRLGGLDGLAARGHPVVQFGLGDLIDAQTDALAVLVDADDADKQFITLPRPLLWVGDVVARHLADVDQPGDTVWQLDEHAVVHNAADRAGHEVAHREGLLDRAPRVRDERLAVQADALTLHVHVLDANLDLLADGENIARVVHVLPVQLGDVDEPVHPADI